VSKNVYIPIIRVLLHGTPQVDMCSLEEVDEMAHMPNSIPISCSNPPLNLDGLLERIWDMMALVRGGGTVRGLDYRGNAQQSVEQFCIW